MPVLSIWFWTATSQFFTYPFKAMKNVTTAIILASIVISGSECCARPPADINEALECTFFVSTFSKDGKPYAAGTAFLVEESGTQWIYTNAHVIDGATKIEIRDKKNQPVTGFGRFACYSAASGIVSLATGDNSSKDVKVRFVGDGVRLELKSKREIAFDVHDKSFLPSKGLKVVTIGDNGGDRKMEVMEGEVTTTSPAVVLTTCKTDHGSSGGALIDQKTMKVIGLNTWGLSNKLKPIDAIWQESKTEGRSAGASIIGKATWIELPAAEFLKGSEYAKQFIDATRLLTLIYATTPTESGFSLDYNAKIAANRTYQEAMDKYAWNTMFRPVIDLNRKLGRAKDSNVGINNMEIVNTYAKAIRDIRANYKRLGEEIIKKTPPYYRQELENLGCYEVGGKCHEKLADAETWFAGKASTGGIMPVGVWINLPPLNSFDSK